MYYEHKTINGCKHATAAKIFEKTLILKANLNKTIVFLYHFQGKFLLERLEPMQLNS